MTFKQRLPFFLGGLTIGIIVVVFFLGKKETTFDYLPNARVLKNINTKERIYSDESLAIINSMQIDTSQISKILKKGNVDILNKIKTASCIEYNIEGKKELKNVTLTVENCKTIAIIKKIVIR
ncbi:hypothetical protein [Lutibacter flavus]|uniref:DUF4258 domain-containing protein n=1 Tax=Lutibacter flavus TaxID=691689 RepID=A0A238VPM9_9FLAO|nr:hypothetical protein [Lutibacter flavus]SNR36295.1 hypothetical protein SAMN04488111_0844 [Lutibacter flavus]